jgi:hypothetical protein
MGEERSDQSMPAAARATTERNLARRERELAAEQTRLADIDQSPIGSTRRRAAALHIIAALDHERVADELEAGQE